MKNYNKIHSISNKIFNALKEANVGLRSRKSSRAIANLVGQQLTVSELEKFMTDGDKVALAKSHDTYVLEGDNDEFLQYGANGYFCSVRYHQFIEELPTLQDFVTATVILSLKATKKQRHNEKVYEVTDFHIRYTTPEVCDKFNWETQKWLPDFFIVDAKGIRAIKGIA
jgi:hypothetical protein